VALRGRRKQQGRTVACVKKAAKICHSPKLEDRYPMQYQEAKDFILTEDFLLKMKEINKYKVPTYGGYNPNCKEEGLPLHFPTSIKRYLGLLCNDDK